MPFLFFTSTVSCLCHNQVAKATTVAVEQRLKVEHVVVSTKEKTNPLVVVGINCYNTFFSPVSPTTNQRREGKKAILGKHGGFN